MEGSILSRGDRDFVVYENDNFGGVGGRYWKSKVDIVQVPLFPHCLKRARQGFYFTFLLDNILYCCNAFLSSVWLPRFTYLFRIYF